MGRGGGGGAVLPEGRQCMRSCFNWGGAVRLRLNTKTGGGGGGGGGGLQSAS